MRFALTLFIYLTSSLSAARDNEVQGISGGGQLFSFIGKILVFSFFIYIAYILINVFWNGVLSRKVNIPNYELHMRVANSILNYPDGIDINTWVTRDESKQVQNEVDRIHRLEKENNDEYRKAMLQLYGE